MGEQNEEFVSEHVRFETSVTYTSRDAKMPIGYTSIESITDYPKFASLSPQVPYLVLFSSQD